MEKSKGWEKNEDERKKIKAKPIMENKERKWFSWEIEEVRINMEKRR